MKYWFTLRNLLLQAPLVLGMSLLTPPAKAELVLVTSIENPIQGLDKRDLRNLYKGRLTRVDSTPLKPLDAKPGSRAREAFLSEILDQNEYDYSGYWHVRRYTGQGTPPLQADSVEDLFSALLSQKTAIGYIWLEPGRELALPPGLKALKVK